MYVSTVEHVSSVSSSQTSLNHFLHTCCDCLECSFGTLLFASCRIIWSWISLLGRSVKLIPRETNEHSTTKRHFPLIHNRKSSYFMLNNVKSKFIYSRSMLMFMCWSSAATSELFLVSPPQTLQYTVSCFIVCVLDVVCTAFYKQSMVQSEIRKYCVHPTWFICSEDFSLNETEFF